MKKINPFVSIIMNCHNGEKYLKKSLQSVINQTYKNWELIFWDNRSIDKSKEIVKSFKDKRIKYFKSKKFNSLYESRNQAIKKSKGKYICFLDTDDWWLKKKLINQIDELRKKPEINFIFSNVYLYFQKKKEKKLYFNKKVPKGKITQFLLNNYVIGILTVMMNKDIFKKKKFNKNYNIIGDFDFFINLSLKEQFLCIQKPLAYYRVHDANYSKKTLEYKKEIKKWINKNSLKFKKLNYSLNKIKYDYLKLKIKNYLKRGS
jgi:glycosyltransferase involved in cell wall biosynthesis